MAVTKNLRDGTLKLRDAAGSPHTITIALDDGSLTFTPANPVIQVDDRGTLDHLRKGSNPGFDLSFKVKFVEFTNASTPTVYEFVNGIGSAAAYTYTQASAGTLASSGDVKVFTVIFEIYDVATSTTETLTFYNCYLKDSPFSEGNEYDEMTINLHCCEPAPVVS